MLARLHESIEAVCPIHGVSGSQGNIRIDYKPEATAQQQTDAQAVLAAFDWSPVIQDMWERRKQERKVGNVKAVRLGADRVNSTVNFADCTGLEFDLAPNSHYAFEFTGAYTAAAGTTGLQLSVNGPASPNLVVAAGQIATSATAVQSGVIAAYDAGLNATASGGSTALPFFVKGNISTGAAGGTFVLRFRSEVAASAVTIKAGSYGLLYGVS